MSFAIVLQGMSVVTYLVILSGGKRLRENGWTVLSLMVGLSAIVQAAGMSIVVSCVMNRVFAIYRGPLLIGCRHICLITRTDSLLAGNLINPGSFVQLVGASVFSALVQSFWLPRSCPLKEATS